MQRPPCNWTQSRAQLSAGLEAGMHRVIVGLQAQQASKHSEALRSSSTGVVDKAPTSQRRHAARLTPKGVDACCDPVRAGGLPNIEDMTQR